MFIKRLRDSCRDETFVRNEAGERLLERTLVVEGIPPGGFVATAASVAECGLLEVTINEEICTFDPEMLGAYASRVAELVDAGSGGYYKEEEDKLAWLRPFDGVPGSPAPNAIDLWTAKGGPEIPIISFEEAMTPAGNLKMLRHVTCVCLCLCQVTKSRARHYFTAVLSDFHVRMEPSLGDLQNLQICSAKGSRCIRVE